MKIGVKSSAQWGIIVRSLRAEGFAVWEKNYGAKAKAYKKI